MCLGGELGGGLKLSHLGLEIRASLALPISWSFWGLWRVEIIKHEIRDMEEVSFGEASVRTCPKGWN